MTCFRARVIPTIHRFTARSQTGIRAFKRLLRTAGHLSDLLAAVARLLHLYGAGQTGSFVTDIETNMIATVE